MNLNHITTRITQLVDYRQMIDNALSFKLNICRAIRWLLFDQYDLFVYYCMLFDCSLNRPYILWLFSIVFRIRAIVDIREWLEISDPIVLLCALYQHMSRSIFIDEFDCNRHNIRIIQGLSLRATNAYLSKAIRIGIGDSDNNIINMTHIRIVSFSWDFDNSNSSFKKGNKLNFTDHNSSVLSSKPTIWTEINCCMNKTIHAFNLNYFEIVFLVVRFAYLLT